MSSRAEETELDSAVSCSFIYDDNIFFSRNKREYDSIYMLSPDLGLSYSTARLALKTGISGKISKYIEHREQDKEYYSLNLSGSGSLSEKLALNTAITHSKDSTLDSELSKTGILMERSDVSRENLGAGISFSPDEKMRVILNGSYTKIDYESEKNTDYDGSSLSLTFTRTMDSGRDTLFLQPYYSENSSSISSVNNLGIYAGWSKNISEIWSFSASIGARRTKTLFFTWEKKAWGLLVDCSLEKKGETWSSGINLTRDLKYSTSGDPVETDSLNINFRKKISGKMVYAVSGNLTVTESTTIISPEDTQYFKLRNTFTYMICEEFYLTGSYTHSINHNALLIDNRSAERNMFTISLGYNFDKRL